MRINALFQAVSRGFSELSESHRILQQTCKNFAKTELEPIASQFDKQCTFPTHQIQKLGAMGVMGVLIPKQYGGGGFDTLALSIAVEEISKGCGGTGAIVSIHNALYADVLNRFGTEEQKNKFLEPFANGCKIGSFALSEPGNGSDAANMLTKAVNTGKGWILNGRKSWVTSAAEAQAVIIFARMADEDKIGYKGISAFLLPIPTKGLSIGKKVDKLGIRASSTCDIIMEDVVASKENLLGKEGMGFKIAMSSIDCARIGIASQALGIAGASLECAVRYSGKREAFGSPILTLQAVQHKIARVASRLEGATLMTRKAAQLRDAGKNFTKAASMAKMTASELATYAAHNCAQILGGVGYTQDMPAQRYYRDARITEIYGGPTDIQLLVIAEQVAKEYGLKTRPRDS